MTDQELIKRLRDWKEHDEGKNNDAREAAADRIEELVKERDELAAALNENWVTHLEVMQAKMQRAKAVEALRNIEADCDADYPPSHGAIKYTIRAVLAELEGKDHD